jgi:hypothetical protein
MSAAMRAVLALVLLVILSLGQGLLVHAHQPANAHLQLESTAHHEHRAHVHSHVIDAEAVDLDHLQSIDEDAADLPFRMDSSLYAGSLAGVVWAVIALVFSPRSGFRVRTPPPRPAAHSRPPICLRPAPQGPPC